MNNNEQKCTTALAEILADPSSKWSWARKSKLLTLTTELSPLEMNLVEFDVATKFNEAKEMARSAQKIFQTDKSDERVRHRMGQLFTVLLSEEGKQFSRELVEQLPMDTLQEMFFFAFPEQRNSTRGSLQVYLIWASNQPQSLHKIATKLFAYYLGASGEFQQKCNSSSHPEEEVTPLDAVLFHLLESLVQAEFGDLSLHNILQLFHILLRNCYADSLGLLGDEFYAQSGIPLLVTIPRPSVSWHFCVHVIAKLFERRAQPVLANAFQPLPLDSNGQTMSATLEKAMSDEGASAELFKSVEFVRLVICWALASPIRNIQIDLINQLVSLPANVFWVTPSALEHHWLYNLEPEEDDSPAEIEEPQRIQKTLRVNPSYLEPVRKLNALFSSSPIADQQFLALAHSSLHIPNAHSAVVLALMLSQNWKRAAELLEHFETSTEQTSSVDQSLLRVQQLQTLIQLRQLPKALSICIELLKEFKELPVDEQNEHIPPQMPQPFPLVVSQDLSWIRLNHRDHLRLFLLLHFFHICWLAFAKCIARSAKDKDDEAEFCFLALIVSAQSCWADFGFGLFAQLCEHVAAKNQFRCPHLFRYVSNAVLMDELFGLDHVQMVLSPDDGDGTGIFVAPSEWHKAVMEGRIRLAGKPAFALFEQFLADNQQRMSELLQRISN